MNWVLPNIQALYATLDATWPAAKINQIGGWMIREGQGGGKRVSAATMIGLVADIKIAESEMSALGQSKLFMIKEGDQALDDKLANAGYSIIDPVVLLASQLQITQTPYHEAPNLPNDEMEQIWQKGGIGPGRIAVMNRAEMPKCFSCIDNSAVAFSAIHNGICMTHAVEVLSTARRQGLGKRIMEQIEHWAASHGAHTLSVITVLENKAARNLYSSLGMKEVGYYHYRIKA